MSFYGIRLALAIRDGDVYCGIPGSIGTPIGTLRYGKTLEQVVDPWFTKCCVQAAFGFRPYLPQRGELVVRLSDGKRSISIGVPARESATYDELLMIDQLCELLGVKPGLTDQQEGGLIPEEQVRLDLISEAIEAMRRPFLMKNSNLVQRGERCESTF